MCSLSKLGIVFLISLLSCTSNDVLARNSEMEAELASAFARGELRGLHSVLVLRNGEVFAEAYFPGEDERWGSWLGHRDHGPDSLHDLRSVTKSIVSVLYGIALAEGLVPAVEESLIAQFPEYDDLAADPERREILVRHALTMQMGTEWNEDLPYTDPRNSEIAMELADDRYRYALDRPIVHPPGQQWTYNGGATALIGRLIAKGVGMPIDVYAKEKLFAPLGITEFEWVAGADGVPSAASGLRLHVHDLAKIGQLIVNGGKAEGKQIVPAAWLDAALAPQADTGELRYGYFWWLAPDGDPPVWVAGFGNGGQRLSINRARGLVVVVFAGNYNQKDAWRLPVKVITDFLVPALEDG
jgi:CubicO group peptidase (beta-lactamase class C family)